jgi:hypothetical protein
MKKDQHELPTEGLCDNTSRFGPELPFSKEALSRRSLLTNDLNWKPWMRIDLCANSVPDRADIRHRRARVPNSRPIN